MIKNLLKLQKYHHKGNTMDIYEKKREYYKNNLINLGINSDFLNVCPCEQETVRNLLRCANEIKQKQHNSLRNFNLMVGGQPQIKKEKLEEIINDNKKEINKINDDIKNAQAENRNLKDEYNKATLENEKYDELLEIIKNPTKEKINELDNKLKELEKKMQENDTESRKKLDEIDTMVTNIYNNIDISLSENDKLHDKINETTGEFVSKLTVDVDDLNKLDMLNGSLKQTTELLESIPNYRDKQGVNVNQNQSQTS